LLAELTEASYAREIETDEQVLAYARDWLAADLIGSAHARDDAQ
jgi:hypothetical protein